MYGIYFARMKCNGYLPNISSSVNIVIQRHPFNLLGVFVETMVPTKNLTKN